MHIYSEEEYVKKLKVIIKKRITTPVSIDSTILKNNVIKNYIYYDKTVKIV